MISRLTLKKAFERALEAFAFGALSAFALIPFDPSEPKRYIYALLTERMNERLIRYWKIIQTTIDNREIIVALNSLREEDKDLVKRAQIVGLLPRNLLEGANLINAPNSEVNITQEDKRVINIIWGEKPDDKT